MVTKKSAVRGAGRQDPGTPAPPSPRRAAEPPSGPGRPLVGQDETPPGRKLPGHREIPLVAETPALGQPCPSAPHHRRGRDWAWTFSRQPPALDSDSNCQAETLQTWGPPPSLPPHSRPSLSAGAAETFLRPASPGLADAPACSGLSCWPAAPLPLSQPGIHTAPPVPRRPRPVSHPRPPTISLCLRLWRARSDRFPPEPQPPLLLPAWGGGPPRPSSQAGQSPFLVVRSLLCVPYPQQPGFRNKFFPLFSWDSASSNEGVGRYADTWGRAPGAWGAGLGGPRLWGPGQPCLPGG